MKTALFFLLILFVSACQTGTKNNSGTNKTEGQVQLTEVKIQVGGMHCDMCAASIEKGISELQGIDYVKSTLADSITVVRFDSKKVDLPAIEKAIEKRGYTIRGKL
jgi:copper chaperone